MPEKCTRETQLSERRNQCWNTTRESWTQVERRGVLLSCNKDYILLVGQYKDSKVWLDKHIEATIVIQKYARRWIAFREAKRLRMHADSMCQLFQEQEKQKRIQAEQAVQQEINKRKNPRTNSDFKMLYHDLESWRVQELKVINSKEFTYEERKLAIQELLQKEVKLLQAIENMKLVAAKETQHKRIRKMMMEMSASKTWELSNGQIVHVRTPTTQRASDLMQLYTALGKAYKNIDDRMCVLGYIKWTVQEFKCPLTEEIMQLIEREADLMYRNRSPKSLQGLRERILDLFLEFMKNPEFNPEAKAYQCIPSDFDDTSHQSMTR